jgi:hypothetical protein
MCGWESPKEYYNTKGELMASDEVDDYKRVIDVRLPAEISKKLRELKKAKLGNQHIDDRQIAHVTLKNGKTIKNVVVIHLSYVVLNKKYKTNEIVDVKIKKPWMLM